MTDILDMPGWSVISSHQDGDIYTIEAEYTKPLEACTKCGVIGRLYRHGTKPVTYRDAPIRGCHTQILARVQRYRCRDCGGIFDESELFFHHEGAFPIFDISPETIQIVCGKCNARLHTGAAN